MDPQAITGIADHAERDLNNLALTSGCEYTQHAPAWPRDNSIGELDAPGG